MPMPPTPSSKRPNDALTCPSATGAIGARSWKVTAPLGAISALRARKARSAPTSSTCLFSIPTSGGASPAGAAGGGTA